MIGQNEKCMGTFDCGTCDERPITDLGLDRIIILKQLIRKLK
jgi:hypothetical protein